jgi:hypothetical protein
MKLSKNIIIAVVATLIIAGSGGFYGGMLYEKSQAPVRGNFALMGGQGANANRVRQGFQGAGSVNGEILSKDDKSITVKDRNGGSRIIFFAPSTAIGKMAVGSQDDLTIGMGVMASGTANPDGSITAQSVQIRPEGETGFPQGPGR